LIIVLELASYDIFEHMKPISLFCYSIIILFLTISLRAQVTIGPGDMPVAGSIVPYTTLTLPNDIDETMTGAGITWDYSSLGIGDDGVDTFVTVEQTPLLFQFYFNNAFFYPDYLASYALGFPDVAAGPVSLSNVYNYYKSDDQGLHGVGFGAEVNGLPSSVRNIPIDVVYEFPLDYLNESQSHSESELELPTLGFYASEQDREVIAEGWGTLVLPGGESYDVLKVKTIINGRDSIYIELAGQGFAIDRPETTVYDWLSPGQEGPLLTVTSQAIAPSTVRYRNNTLIGLDELSLTSVMVSPNPVQDRLTIDLLDAITQYVIYDMAGKCVKVGEKQDTKAIYVGDLGSGAYTIRLLTSSGLYSGTFIKD